MSARANSAQSRTAPHTWRDCGQRWLCVFLKGVLFRLKDVLKEKLLPSANDGWHSRTDMLKLRQTHFWRFVDKCLESRASKNLNNAPGHAISQFQKVLDEPLVDFRCCLFKWQQCKESGNEPP